MADGIALEAHHMSLALQEKHPAGASLSLGGHSYQIQVLYETCIVYAVLIEK